MQEAHWADKDDTGAAACEHAGQRKPTRARERAGRGAAFRERARARAAMTTMLDTNGNACVRELGGGESRRGIARARARTEHDQKSGSPCCPWPCRAIGTQSTGGAHESLGYRRPWCRESEALGVSQRRNVRSLPLGPILPTPSRRGRSSLRCERLWRCRQGHDVRMLEQVSVQRCRAALLSAWQRPAAVLPEPRSDQFDGALTGHASGLGGPTHQQ